jgi:hypothetical protein
MKAISIVPPATRGLPNFASSRSMSIARTESRSTACFERPDDSEVARQRTDKMKMRRTCRRS